MFSQFRNVVESLSPTAGPPSKTNATMAGSPSPSRGRSDSPMTRSARKAPGSQSTASPTRKVMEEASHLLEARRKMTLEERLKAKFTLGEASESTTTETSQLHTPQLEEIDPSSIPLPPSPTTVHIDLTRESRREDPLLGLTPSIASSPTQASHVPATLSERGGTIEAPLPLQAPHDETPSLEHSFSSSPSTDTLGVDQLREALKLLQKRFFDVSSSCERLQAEKEVADQILSQHTSVTSISDTESLTLFFETAESKTRMASEEIKRVQNLQKCRLIHDDQVDELRDIHRLESSSQSEQIERLRKQLSESEKLLVVHTSDAAAQKDEKIKFAGEMEKLKTAAKEEEEKRVKAVGLLKTVRQKLVKTEKEREEAVKELDAITKQSKTIQSKDASDRAEWMAKLEALKTSTVQEMQDAKSRWERERAALRAELQQEAATVKGQMQLEIVTLKAAHARELSSQTSHATSVETSLRRVTQEKDSLFDQVQMRSAELESSQSRLEEVQTNLKELEFQLRESGERLATANEVVSDLRQHRMENGQSSSAKEVAGLLLETEGKYESRLSEARSKIKVLERERVHAEEEWTRGIYEKSKAMESLRRDLERKDEEKNTILARQRDSDSIISDLEARVKELEVSLQRREEELDICRNQQAVDRERESALRQELHDASERIESLVLQMETLKNHEGQFRATNKTLREELRKVQSSVALLEKQRNPGLGYWSNLSQRADTLSRDTTESRASSSSESSSRSVNGTNTGVKAQSEEEVSFEYLRNVILQFLEHKEMRSNLVRVLSTILHFTPQETRRLLAKV